MPVLPYFLLFTAHQPYISALYPTLRGPPDGRQEEGGPMSSYAGALWLEKGPMGGPIAIGAVAFRI